MFIACGGWSVLKCHSRKYRKKETANVHQHPPFPGSETSRPPSLPRGVQPGARTQPRMATNVARH